MPYQDLGQLISNLSVRHVSLLLQGRAWASAKRLWHRSEMPRTPHS